MTAEDEESIVERWIEVQKLGDDDSSSIDHNIHHHPFRFKHTDNMSIQDIKHMLNEKGMTKSKTFSFENRSHDEEIHHGIFDKLHSHKASQPVVSSTQTRL